MARDLPTSLVYARRLPLVGKLAYYMLKMLGVEIPLKVPVGENFELAHGGVGVVIHSSTVIGNHVKIYPGVTLGRADIHRPMSASTFEGIVIAKRNRGLNSAFTVRKISHGTGVERVFQTHSPIISEIIVKRRGDVRRAKLYYLRDLTGKAARIKEKL